MIIMWIILALLGGAVLGAGLVHLLASRHPVLLWPQDWLPAIRLRGQRRKMTDRSDRISS